MNLSTYIQLENVRCKVELGSKKKSLVLLSEILATDLDDICQDEILGKLKERERLGSTGLGAGIAIPHCRLKGLDHAKLAFITLDQPVNFDSVDNQDVDLMFCLIVPETCTDTHLQILAYLANMLSDKNACHTLRHCTDEINLYKFITNWSTDDQNSAAVLAS